MPHRTHASLLLITQLVVTDPLRVEVLDAILDYPTYYALANAFSNNTADLSQFTAIVEQSQSSYKNGEFFTGGFSENQDNPRWPARTSDTSVR